MKVNKMVFTFSSLPENVTISRMLLSAVGSQLNLPINELENSASCCIRGCSNSIIHGYKNNPGLCHLGGGIKSEKLQFK